MNVLQGMVDTEGFKKIHAAAHMTKHYVDIGEWKLSTQHWSYTQSVVLQETHNIDFYNILTKRRKDDSKLNHLSPQDVLSFNEGI